MSCLACSGRMHISHIRLAGEVMPGGKPGRVMLRMCVYADGAVQDRHYLAVGGCSALPLDTITRLQAALLRRRAAR